MTFPERFSDLPEYAFPRLRRLLDGTPPGGEVVRMTIGEPQHPFPDWVIDEIEAARDGFGRYPPNDGTPELRGAIADWLARRYGVSLSPETAILPVNGTREALFNIAIALSPERKGAGGRPAVIMPNPFYQVYAVAALAVGADPVYVPAGAETGFLPDFSALPPALLDRVTLAYVCSPSNPQGAVAGGEYWRGLLDLAERHDFRIVADECYAEIYRDTAPTGLLQVAAAVGADPERAIVFHSLSKRSNLPGLRSGFVAGGPESIARMKQLRAYAGAPLPVPLQAAAVRLWSDEAHVVENRALYAAKYKIAEELLDGVPGAEVPQAGFFLWLPVEDGEAAALRLWAETGVQVLPGAYLGREVDGTNPGRGYIRVALVAPEQQMRDGLIRLRECLYS